jgi:hypothetical protein
MRVEHVLIATACRHGNFIVFTEKRKRRFTFSRVLSLKEILAPASPQPAL